MNKVILFLSFLLLSTSQLDAQYDRLYQVSHLYPKGLYEVHLFNNHFTRAVKTNGSDDYNQRESFYTLWAQVTYGLTDRFNVGLDLRVRSVVRTEGSVGNFFDALRFRGGGNFNEDGVTGYRRVDATNLGLRVKYQPLDFMPNFSIEHILFVPLADDLEGNDFTGFADWQAGIIWNRMFIDQMIGSNFLLFTELDFIVEDVVVPFLDEDAYYQVGFPMTIIGTYLASSKSFFYGMLQVAPTWGTNTFSDGRDRETRFVPYTQIGAGAKYFFQPWLQTELLISKFYDVTPNANTWTVNLGLRVFGLTAKARREYQVY
jgi:hypothetical protein